MSTQMQFGGMNQQLGQAAATSLFRYRTTAYKVGLLLLLASFGLFILGYSTHHWVTFRERFSDYGISVGLWNGFHHFGNYGFMVAMIIFSIHLAGYFVCIGVTLFENLRKVNPLMYYSRRLEICILITAILGTAGLIAFVLVIGIGGRDYRYNWSMILTSLTVSGLYVTLFLIIVGNKKPPALQPLGIYTGAPTSITYSTQPVHSSTIIQAHGPHVVYQYGPHSQPLLSPQPTYAYPPPPPPYSYPPTYPMYTTTQYQPVQQYDFHSAAPPQSSAAMQASAPPMEDNTQQGNVLGSKHNEVP
ncbi:uncharacterized protein LOC131941715 [Physella acuta]|uniref:uncharacterized protein LOC131941715 n=1 Tax=Physella acuta TaxID=109671 RepID=UPI0027DB11D8|nr:uncharacterized protein LOC131941715 [Physella acuta]